MKQIMHRIKGMMMVTSGFLFLSAPSYGMQILEKTPRLRPLSHTLSQTLQKRQMYINLSMTMGYEIKGDPKKIRAIFNQNQKVREGLISYEDAVKDNVAALPSQFPSYNDLHDRMHMALDNAIYFQQVPSDEVYPFVETYMTDLVETHFVHNHHLLDFSNMIDRQDGMKCVLQKTKNYQSARTLSKNAIADPAIKKGLLPKREDDRWNKITYDVVWNYYSFMKMKMVSGKVPYHTEEDISVVSHFVEEQLYRLLLDYQNMRSRIHNLGRLFDMHTPSRGSGWETEKSPEELAALETYKTKIKTRIVAAPYFTQFNELSKETSLGITSMPLHYVIRQKQLEKERAEKDYNEAVAKGIGMGWHNGGYEGGFRVTWIDQRKYYSWDQEKFGSYY